MGTSFNLVLEEQDKNLALAQVGDMESSGQINAANASGIKAIINAQGGSQVSIAFVGSNEPSGYLHVSWFSHSDIRDVPTDEERQIPNEAGKDEHGQFHPEWEGMRTAAMTKRLGRVPKH